MWNSVGEDTITKTVQANTIGPEPDSRPWVLTGKNLWPEGETFSTYGEDYYIAYTYKDTLPDDRLMYMYEIKRKTSTVKPILDYNKIYGDMKKGLFSDAVTYEYEIIKSMLGLEEEFGGPIMEFNISVEIRGDPEHPDPLYFGHPEPENVIAKEVTSRRVLIYYPPTILPGPNPDVETYPEYKNGEITVRIFLGGVIRSS